MGGFLLGGAVTLGVTLSLWRGRRPMLNCRLGEWSAISPRARRSRQNRFACLMNLRLHYVNPESTRSNPHAWPCRGGHACMERVL